MTDRSRTVLPTTETDDREGVRWPDDVDAIIRGDLTAAAAYVTSGGGVVVTGVAPCGMSDRGRGSLGFTTSLGFGKKLKRIVRDPRVALAYHAREHGFASGPQFVLAQGMATVDLRPSLERLEAFRPSAERFLGDVKEGRIWDPLLRAYYQERVFVDVAAERLTVWPDLSAQGAPTVFGNPGVEPPPPQPEPAKGSAPRIDMDKAAGQLSSLPHRLVGYRGSDGYPVVVPVEIGSRDGAGFCLLAAPGVLPPGGRRAGLLAHSYRPQLIGLSTRVFTGWLEVAGDGVARYAPHTSVGYSAPPVKDLLLVVNGLMAHFGLWRARRNGLLQELERLSSGRGAPLGG